MSPECEAERAFACTVAIRVAGVKVHDAEIKRSAHEPHCALYPAGRGMAEANTPEPERHAVALKAPAIITSGLFGSLAAA